ncbi:hypothetical protein BsWGS_01503 [Bradybaena similaris]
MVVQQSNLSAWLRPRPSHAPIQAGPSNGHIGQPGQTKQTPNPDTALTVVHWNAEGVSNKKIELQEFLRKHEVDVICIQESHLKEPTRFSVRGYECFRHDRPTKAKGGIITLVKTSIPAVEIDRSNDTELEHLTVKLLFDKDHLLITNCYSPPTTPLTLHRITINEANHLIVGDFNSHSPSWGYEATDPRGEELEDWMVEHKLILINKPNDTPTYYSRAWKKTSTPDLAMATDDIVKHTTRLVNSQLGGSDHVPITLKIHKGKRLKPPSMAPSWNYKKANWTLYREHVEKHCLRITQTNNLNHNVTDITRIILDAAKNYIPRGRRYNYKPFWNNTLEKQHNALTKAHKAMEDNPSPANIKLYNDQKDKFNKEKITSCQNAWHEKTSSLNMEKDTNKLWNLIKAINEDTTDNRQKIVIKEAEKHYTGKDAANLLADYYSNECNTTIPKPHAQKVNRDIKNKLKHQNPTPSMMTPFTMEELHRATIKLKKKKAPGKDGVTNEMITHLGQAAKEKLLLIYNQSWNSGKFPDKWREAVILPIKKNQKPKSDKASYRPISLLSCLGKVMERMVNTRLMKHLEEKHLIANPQTAYRKNHSTEDQLIYLAQEIENAFQDKKKMLAVFIDLTKAFEKVWKKGLLLKLLNNKVEGKMFLWIRDFISYRTARVKIDGKLSNKIDTRQGVPQGGVISPSLFLIYINDIIKELPSHTPSALHADDLAIWHASENTSTANLRIQEALDNIAKWATDWGVQINPSKTTAKVFSLSNKPDPINLHIHGREITHTEQPTYLGVKLDKRLTWKPHLLNTENKAIRKLGTMKKLAGTTWGANMDILKRTYLGTVRPTLEYGMTAWATAAKTNTAHLRKVQNTGLRLITGGMKSTPIQELERTTKIQPLEERRAERILMQSQKIIRLNTHPLHNKLQIPPKNRLKRSSFNHLTRELQNQHKDILPSEQNEIEPLRNYEQHSSLGENISIHLEVPGIQIKHHQNPLTLKTLSLEMIDNTYNPTQWTHVYTDGSAQGAVRNGGGGIYIKHSDGRTTKKAIATGKMSSNYRAESMALLEALRMLGHDENAPQGKLVFFTDCKSLLESLQTPKDSRATTEDIITELNNLPQSSQVALQWIPSHCGIAGNEIADTLSKTGSNQNQYSHPVDYKEAKTIIRNKCRTDWKHRLQIDNRLDPIQLLSRHAQTTIFRLRTGHCRLRSHLYRLGITHTDECNCGEGVQTPEHLLQDCSTHTELRRTTWPQEQDLESKLWGSLEDLDRTVGFILATGEKI